MIRFFWRLIFFPAIIAGCIIGVISITLLVPCWIITGRGYGRKLDVASDQYFEFFLDRAEIDLDWW